MRDMGATEPVGNELAVQAPAARERGNDDLILDRRLLAPHALQRWAAEDPERVALQHVDGMQLSYGQLHREALTFAAALRARTVGTGDHVGTLLPNEFDAYRVLLALAWLRAVEVPLNTAYTGSILGYALDQADVTTLLTVGRFADRLQPLVEGLPRLQRVILLDEAPHTSLPVEVIERGAFLGSVGPARDLHGPDCWDTAALLFTSGTTGPSKAVSMPWGAIYQNWSWVPTETFGPGEALHCALPLFHNSGRSGFNCVLARGGRFVMRDRFSASSVWEETRRADCTALALVGPLTSLLYSAPPRDDDADNPVRHVVLGPMIPDMEDFERRFDVKVCGGYGQTEIGVPLVYGWDHGPWTNTGRVRGDYPWPEVRIVDEHDRPLGPGEAGELVVRTRAPWGLNVGYYKMPDQTAAAWRNGWFHTGDVLTYDRAGRFYFVDRLKDAIRRRGENISSFEVEKLVSEHPDVLECAAVGVATSHGDEEVLVAVIVADPDQFDPAALIDFLVPRMPSFMVPRYVEIAEALPRSETTGRVRKQVLRARGLTDRAWDRYA